MFALLFVSGMSLPSALRDSSFVGRALCMTKYTRKFVQIQDLEEGKSIYATR